jgi:hypothetical protein
MAGGGNVAARLGQHSVRFNLCHSYQSFNTCYTDTGLWGTYIVTDRMRIEDAMCALQDEWYLIGFQIFIFFKLISGVVLQQHVLILK